MNNEIYLRRRGCIVPPYSWTRELLPLEFVATLSVNLEDLGYALSKPLMEACRQLTAKDAERFYLQLRDTLACATGAHRKHAPMYPNFPQQVMNLNRAELYFNAVVHYWSDGKLLPATPKGFRLPFKEVPTVKFIELGTKEDFMGLITQIASANVAFSEQDLLDLKWFIGVYHSDSVKMLPTTIPQRENLAHLAAILLRQGEVGEEFLRTHVRTATDVLRVACALSKGDVSLAAPTRFKAIRRPLRRLLLERIEAHESALDDMRRRPERWKRLGERLHPGEFAGRYPKTARAFEAIREDIAGATFRGKVEAAVRRCDVPKATAIAGARPGELIRRLDHLLRIDTDANEQVLARLEAVADQGSTPLLLQARHHFATRGEPRDLRVFMPKGDVAKSHAEPNWRPSLPQEVRERVVEILEGALVRRFAKRPPMGRVYVDAALRDYPVPFAMRSASKALRTVPRGSRLPLPEGDTLRLFLWWTNGSGRTDIDLSVVLFGDGFVYKDEVAYYNLKREGCVHSGDIVDAPQGASEFVDLQRSALLREGVRYAGMVVTGYTPQPYSELPECFAGWMLRRSAQSGEIFEPRTVLDRFDLTANTRVAIPIVFDLVEKRAIWCDMALKRRPNFNVDVRANRGGIVLTMESMAALNKPTLYDLIRLHAEARGTRVTTAAEAESVFSVASGFPFELERIASEFMA